MLGSGADHSITQPERLPRHALLRVPPSRIAHHRPPVHEAKTGANRLTPFLTATRLSIARCEVLLAHGHPIAREPRHVSRQRGLFPATKPRSCQSPQTAPDDRGPGTRIPRPSGIASRQSAAHPGPLHPAPCCARSLHPRTPSGLPASETASNRVRARSTHVREPPNGTSAGQCPACRGGDQRARDSGSREREAPSDNHLRPCVPAPDSAHHPAAGLPIDNVRHPRRSCLRPSFCHFLRGICLAQSARRYRRIGQDDFMLVWCP